MRVIRLFGGAVAAAACATAWVLACGPFVTAMPSVTVLVPADPSAFARGDLGVVRPRFARRYLLQAYRTLSGQGVQASRALEVPQAHTPPDASASRSVVDLRREIVGSVEPAPPYFNTEKLLPDYISITNCPRAAFETALRTRHAREERFGARSAEVREWARGQAAVFENCSGTDLVLPPEAPADIDPMIRADRAYQTAAAYFYATQYAEAAERFLAIGADRGSPWKPYGRYLAARAMIRDATVFDDDQAASAQLLEKAVSELDAVLEDQEAAALHASARGLRSFVKAKVEPIERLRELSAALTAPSEPSESDVTDYVMIMNRVIGDTVDYNYASIEHAPAIVASSDLNDWVLAMQANGPEASARALDRWKEKRTLPWLVAALWRAEPSDPAFTTLLDAATRVKSDSPGYATVAFLRVRLLARRGDRAGARAVLATLPLEPQPGFSRESINLLRAERLLVADDMRELLVNAPRFVAAGGQDRSNDTPVFDDDAGIVFDRRLPLRRLIEAVAAPALPERLRRRVALSAFARAVILRRDDEGQRAAQILRDLTPDLREELDAYLRARTADDRHFAGILLLLRTPGVSIRVNGAEDDVELEKDQPAREFDHLFRDNWWCGDPWSDQGTGQFVIAALHGPEGRVAFPAFLDEQEQMAVDEEFGALVASGTGKRYLTSEAVAWAQARPGDGDAAEALALAIEGWRWGCYVANDDWTIARTAFETLHKLFPQSSWARRTKYWYKG